MRNSRNIKQYAEKRNFKAPFHKNNNENNTSRSNNVSERVIRCLNCKKEGHIVSQCKQPIKKCGKCFRIGHDTEHCFTKTSQYPVEKSVNRVFNRDTSGDKYFKAAVINKIPLNAFVDLGSECSMLKYSEVSKLGINQISTENLPSLKGFGNSIVAPFGKVNVKISLDGVEADTELLIVPDDVMNVPLMIGQTFTEQPHITISKTYHSLDFFSNYDCITVSAKINVYCKTDTTLPNGINIVDVYTIPKFSGDLFIEGGYRNSCASPHYLPSGLFNFDDQGLGKIVINNLLSDSFQIKGDALIVRGKVAHAESSTIEHHVMTVSNQAINEIQLSDLKLGTLDKVETVQLLALLNKYRHCFAFTMAELGNTNITAMKIDLSDNEPVVYRPYRLAIKEKEVVREIVTELLENNIVRHSTSSYASPVVLVRKKQLASTAFA